MGQLVERFIFVMKNLEKIYDEFYTKEHFSGAGLVKKGDNTIFAKAYGYAHRGFEIKNTIDTMFDTASVTKLYTATAILQIVDKGILKLGDFVTNIVDLSGTKISKDVTIFHLLTHTSGIADDADEEAGENYEDLFINKPNYSIRNCTDFIPQFAFKEPNFKPGMAVRYNNCAYVLLGLVIEKLTGNSYKDYITENLFKKCGMSRSKFYAKDEADADMAEGYYAVEDESGQIQGWKKNIYSFPPIGTADGGAYSSVGDIDIFIRALNAGKLLSDKMSKEIMKPQLKIEQKYEWGKIINGFGFHFVYDNDENLIRIYKDGINAGVAAMVAYYPEKDITNIILGNQTCNVWGLHYKVEQVVLRNY